MMRSARLLCRSFFPLLAHSCCCFPSEPECSNGQLGCFQDAVSITNELDLRKHFVRLCFITTPAQSLIERPECAPESVSMSVSGNYQPTLARLAYRARSQPGCVAAPLSAGSITVPRSVLAACRNLHRSLFMNSDSACSLWFY